MGRIPLTALSASRHSKTFVDQQLPDALFCVAQGDYRARDAASVHGGAVDDIDSAIEGFADKGQRFAAYAKFQNAYCFFSNTLNIAANSRKMQVRGWLEL